MLFKQDFGDLRLYSWSDNQVLLCFKLATDCTNEIHWIFYDVERSTTTKTIEITENIEKLLFYNLKFGLKI